MNWKNSQKNKKERYYYLKLLRAQQYWQQIAEMVQTIFLKRGGMAEWLKAAVLKTVERKFRGFESYSLRHWWNIEDP